MSLQNVQQDSETSAQDDAEYGLRLSYKFQRLRERIRSAIETGELAGKLPGERILARKFKVNAKTLSKALTALAAEGVLERSIGLGTFVRGSNQPKAVVKCLVLHDPDQANCPILDALKNSGAIFVQRHIGTDELPPSLLNPHRWILVCSKQITDIALRDLVVRGKTVIQIDRQGATYATHAVMIDRLAAAADLARRLHRAGHSDLMLIGAERPTDIHKELVALLPASISLGAGSLDDLRVAIEHGVTGLICTSAETASHVIAVLTGLGVGVPEQISIVALGRLDGEAACTGQYVRLAQVVDAIRHLFANATPHRPIALWLAGDYIDANTLTPYSYDPADQA